MKLSTRKAANTATQNAGHAVRHGAVVAVTESADMLILIGTSFFSLGKGLFTAPKPVAPKTTHARVAKPTKKN